MSQSVIGVRPRRARPPGSYNRRAMMELLFLGVSGGRPKVQE